MWNLIHTKPSSSSFPSSSKCLPLQILPLRNGYPLELVTNVLRNIPTNQFFTDRNLKYRLLFNLLQTWGEQLKTIILLEIGGIINQDSSRESFIGFTYSIMMTYFQSALWAGFPLLSDILTIWQEHFWLCLPYTYSIQ